MEQPLLMSSVPDGSGVYPKQVVTLTCETNGSLLVWRSDEYLNNNLEEFTFTPQSVQREQAFGSANAVLKNVTINGSIVTLCSILTLEVAEDYQSFGVSCHGDDSSIVSRKSFYLIGKCCVPVFL